MALELEARSVSFPAISTGIFGYPLDLAAPVALRTVTEYLRGHPEIALVRFVLWDDETRTAYEYAARKLGLTPIS